MTLTFTPPQIQRISHGHSVDGIPLCRINTRTRTRTQHPLALMAMSALCPVPALALKTKSKHLRLSLLKPHNTPLSAASASVTAGRVSVRAMAASNVLTQDDLKKLAADKAVEYVESGMVLGLGTGSTAAFMVSKIGELMKAGQLKNIIGVPTSKRTAEQAASLGIPLSVLDDHPKIDLAIDGADEVDPELNLVKGRGGALLREKMVEAASAKFVVVVDESKLVKGLGGSGLAMPVEVVPFCWKYNANRLQGLFDSEGCEAKLRMDGDKPYITDNSNYIVDLYFKTPIKDARAAGAAMLNMEGVVEHGLFLDMATAVIIAGSDGVTVQSKIGIH